MGNFFRFVSLVLAALAISGGASASTQRIAGATVDLASDARFQAGLNRDAQRPDFDDHAWQRVSMPHVWQAGNAPWYMTTGTYRIRMNTASIAALQEPAFAAFFHREHEVWLNGKRIGGTPFFGLRGAEPTAATGQGRLSVYPVPPDLLRSGQDNIFTLHITRIALVERGGSALYPYVIAERPKAIAAQSKLSRRHWLVNGAIAGMNIIILVFTITALVFGYRQRVVWTFGAFVAFIFLTQAADNHIINDLRLKTPVTDAGGFVAYLFASCIAIEFYGAFLGRNVGLAGRVVQAILCLGVLPGVFVNLTGWAVPEPLIALCLGAQALGLFGGFFGTLTWVMVICIAEMRERNRTGYWLFALFGTTFFAPAMFGLGWPEAHSDFFVYFGSNPFSLGIQLFLLILAGLIALRLTQMERDRQAANLRAIHAQADERARIARDLHDGVAQSLNAHKFQLQMLGSEPAPENTIELGDIDRLVSDVDTMITETSHIARDLAPVSIERFGLEKTLRDHAAKLAQSFGVDVELDLALDPNFSPKRAEHVYRIIQEACSNAIRHGDADAISIKMDISEDSVRRLSICDNGSGFDPEASTAGPGIGIQSIVQRAEALEASASFSKSESGGVQLELKPKRVTALEEGDQRRWSLNNAHINWRTR